MNYPTRFDICRSFRCALLKRYQAGEIDLANARATVERALELISAVKADDPGATGFGERQNLRRQLSDRMKSSSEQDRPNVASRLLKMVALDEFLSGHFREKKDEDAGSTPAIVESQAPTE